jgi:acyl carrier protein
VSDPDPAARLRTLSSGLLSVPEGDLRREALLVDDLGLDSLAAIEWGMAIEDEFGVALPDDAWEVTRAYGDVEDLLQRLLGARA